MYGLHDYARRIRDVARIIPLEQDSFVNNAEDLRYY